MGDYSFVLRGNGSISSLCSGPHGAGRMVSRQKSRRSDESLEKLRIISKIDPKQLASRPDILAEFRRNLLEEAPSAYKDVTPVIQTMVDENIASVVCRNWPLLTIKG